MSSGPKRIPPAGVRPLPGLGGGPSIPGLTPLPPKRSGSSPWVLWLVLVPLLLLGLTWVLGRTVEPVRQRLEAIPLAGKLLFRNPVWPILWNKPVTLGTDPAKSPASKDAASKSGLSDLEAEIAARLTAVEQRENAVAKREADLKTTEPAMQEKQRKLDQGLAEVEALRVQLQGQLRTEQDRVEVIRAMKSASQAQFFSAMTDDEVTTVLKYMTAEEVGKILGQMDSYRSARILHKLTQVAPSVTNP